MALDVEPPDPPTLGKDVDAADYDDVDASGDFHREDLDRFLKEGAWAEAFERWAADASMSREAFDVATDMGLFAEFDFFWDDVADRVGYHAPGVPEDWKAREYHPDLDSWGTVSGINAGLTELGQVVCEVLKEEYVDWESEYEAPDDLPEF